MKTVLIILQIISATILISLILIQAKGTGLGRSFGMSNTTSFSRRGLEKAIFRLTFFLGASFIIISILQVIL